MTRIRGRKRIPPECYAERIECREHKRKLSNPHHKTNSHNSELFVGRFLPVGLCSARNCKVKMRLWGEVNIHRLVGAGNNVVSGAIMDKGDRLEIIMSLWGVLAVLTTRYVTTCGQETPSGNNGRSAVFLFWFLKYHQGVALMQGSPL